MKTPEQIFIENPSFTAAELRDAHNAQAPEPKSGPVYVTYLSLGKETSVFGPAAINVVGTIAEKLAAWCEAPDLSLINPALPNPGALKRIHGRLDGSPGVDFTDAATPGLLSIFASGIDADHQPIITSEHAAGMLALGYMLPAPISEGEAHSTILDVQKREILNALASQVEERQRRAIALLDERHRAILAGEQQQWQTVDELVAAFVG